MSPHLLKIVESYSSSHPGNKYEANAKLIPDLLGWENKPVFIIKSNNKDPKWCHAVWAEGPVLDADTDPDSKGSELVIIWWSEMSPDTSRVLTAVDWEKHAKNYP